MDLSLWIPQIRHPPQTPGREDDDMRLIPNFISIKMPIFENLTVFTIRWKTKSQQFVNREITCNPHVPSGALHPLRTQIIHRHN